MWGTYMCTPGVRPIRSWRLRPKRTEIACVARASMRSGPLGIHNVKRVGYLLVLLTAR